MSHANNPIIRALPFVISFLFLPGPLVYAADKDFPEAPPKLQDAEAKGLHRLSNDELKAFFPGTIDVKRHRGDLVTKTYKPDGSLEVAGSQQNLSGTWRFDEKRNTYCDRIYGKKTQDEHCYAVFSVGDGIHHFDYDISDNLHTVTWRRASAK